MAPAGSLEFPCRGRAGTVYSAGLRRCLIIFAPRTLILDRRTQPCRTPSLPWVLRRSKNFTSGAAVPFTLNGPIGFGRCARPTARVPARPAPHAAGPPGGGHTTRGRTGRGRGAGARTTLPRAGAKASTTPMPHLVDALTCHGGASSRAVGRLEHTEFSTVSVTVDSGGGRAVAKGTGRAGHRSACGCRTPAFEANPLWAPTEGGFRQEQISPSRANLAGAGAYRRGFYPPRRGTGTHRPEGTPHPKARGRQGTGARRPRRRGHPADLRPSGRLQVF